MKKSVYIICLCVLMVLVFYEVEHRGNESVDEGTYVPTAHFVSQVKKENSKEIEQEKNKKIAYLTFDDGPSDNTKKFWLLWKKRRQFAAFLL